MNGLKYLVLEQKHYHKNLLNDKFDGTPTVIIKSGEIFTIIEHFRLGKCRCDNGPAVVHRWPNGNIVEKTVIQ